MSPKRKIGRLPGDGSREEMIKRMVRVNHAGEYGAVRIYEGQLAVLGKTSNAKIIRDMLTQERKHLEKFNELIISRRVRPTAMMPVWHIAGFTLGAASALLGEKTAHACTVAVEEVIDKHYENQIQKLESDDEKELGDLFAQFQLEEIEHRDTAIEGGAKEAKHFSLISKAVKFSSRLAIWISMRI